MNATDFEVSALWAQWVGAGAAVGAVLVAVVFGYLTLANTRRSKDAQERATITAATDSAEPEFNARISDGQRLGWLVRRTNGESFALMNNSTLPVYDVRIEGLTDMDKQRLTIATPQPLTLEAGDAVEFVLLSRLTLSGPANLVLTYSIDPSGSQRVRRVVLVSAP